VRRLGFPLKTHTMSVEGGKRNYCEVAREPGTEECE